MNFVFFLLFLVNLFWSIYLTFLIYRKNRNPKTNFSLPVDTPKNIKINLTRFNPFDDVGGDQSFILCLLDNTNSGVIITSLHNRDFTRIYAKTIKNGDTDGQKLSKEEIQTLLKTISH